MVEINTQHCIRHGLDGERAVPYKVQYDWPIGQGGQTPKSHRCGSRRIWSTLKSGDTIHEDEQQCDWLSSSGWSNGHSQSLSGLDSEWQPSPTGYTERHLAVCSWSVPQGTDCEQQKLLAQAVGPASFRRLVKLEWQLYWWARSPKIPSKSKAVHRVYLRTLSWSVAA